MPEVLFHSSLWVSTSAGQKSCSFPAWRTRSFLQISCFRRTLHFLHIVENCMSPTLYYIMNPQVPQMKIQLPPNDWCACFPFPKEYQLKSTYNRKRDWTRSVHKCITRSCFIPVWKQWHPNPGTIRGLIYTNQGLYQEPNGGAEKKES